jgi:hypothetical protein
MSLLILLQGSSPLSLLAMAMSLEFRHDEGDFTVLIGS